MATWCNGRLVVAGVPAELAPFRRLAHARPSAVFRGDMLVGEVQELFAERAIPLGRNLSRKSYKFQGRSDEGLDHFRDLSRSYPGLRFILVYGWDDHSYGSHFISRGRSRSYKAPDRVVEKVMTKHGVDDAADGEWPNEAEWAAEAELMDLAEAHWKARLID